MSFLSREALTLPQIAAANATLSPSTVPAVSVFTGATAGIGRATLTKLVSRGHPMRAYILGRSAPRHEPFLNELRAANPAAELIFLEGQLSLLSDTARLAADIAGRETAIDALFLCAGFLPFNGRTDTEEGIESSMALGFYSRVLLMSHLMPLLRRAAHPRVVSILAAGLESANIDTDDFDGRRPGVGVLDLARLPPTYTTLAMDRIARDEPGVVVIHNHPGSVATDIIDSALTGRWWMRRLNWLVQPLVRMLSFTPAQSGERCVHLLTSGRYGGFGTEVAAGSAERGLNIDGEAGTGALFLVDMGMNCIGQEKIMGQLRAMGADEKLWAHTRGVLKPYM